MDSLKGDNTKKEKTETITFRLPVSLIEELRRDSKLEDVSLNTFVSKILSSHLEWERFERKVGLLPMTRSFLKEAINQMSEEQIVNLAQRIEKDTFKSILTFMSEKHSVENFVEILRYWLTASWMQHNIGIKDNEYHFNIRHDLGSKWSLYVKTVVSEISQDILKKKAEVSTTDTTISIVFPID